MNLGLYEIMKEDSFFKTNADISENIEQKKDSFDLELEKFSNGNLPDSHIFNLGKPGEILQNCGFPAEHRIELAASRLRMKANQGNHPFEILDIQGLAGALQKPVAVFEYGDKNKSQNVIVNIEKDGKNFLVGVFFNQKQRGYEVSDIRGLFNRDNMDWMHWIQQGKMIYGNKEKIQVLAEQQRTNLAEVHSKEARTSSDSYYLDSVDNILQSFGDVKDIYTKDFPEYAEQKERFEIFKKFRSAYQKVETVNMLDVVQKADEFYDALKSNNKAVIARYTDTIEYTELADAVETISTVHSVTNTNGRGQPDPRFSSDNILTKTELVNKTTSTLVIDSNQAARIKAAREIKENMPSLSEKERAAAIAILEAGAKSQGIEFSEYVEKTFPDGIFGDIKNAENAAKQQGIKINGAVSVNGFGENVKAVIYAGKNADFSTWCHELSHIWQAQLAGELKNDAEEAFQVKNSDWQNSIYTFQDGHTDTSAEAFAYGFEDFLKNKAGEMAAEDKKKIFEKFADYMSRTYNGVKQHIEINEKIASVYQKFVELDDNILVQAEKAVQMEVSFSDYFDKTNSIFFELDSGDTTDVSDSILEGKPIKEISTKEFNYDGSNLKDFALNYIKNNPVENAKTKIGNIEISETGLRHSLSHTIYKNKLYAIPAIKDTLEKGTYLGVIKDFEGKRQNNYYFAAPITIDNDKNILFIRVKHVAGRDKALYIHDIFTLDEIKKVTPYSGEPNATRRSLRGATLAKSIIQDYEKNNIIQNNPILFQTAYHGSGANFDKFNTSEYGLSGEGYMAFGYGTYVTDSETIAKDYASGHGKRKAGKRNFYTVEIPDENYLKWEKKVGIRTIKKIASGLENLGINNISYIRKDFQTLPLYAQLNYAIHNESMTNKGSGKDLYITVGTILHFPADKETSKFFKDMGFSGIQYPAGTVFGDRQNAVNYVIFNDEDIKIKEHFQFQKQEEDIAMKNSKNFESQKYWKNQFQQDNAETFKAIDDYLDKGIRPKNDEFIFEKVPEILKAANVSENEIVIKTSIINKAKNEHSLFNEEIKDSIKNIASPVLIFDSDKTTTENKKESFLCLTDTFAANGKPIAFSMNIDSDYKKNRSILTVNQITSIHDRTLIAKNGTDLIQKWTENGLCRYVDDKKISEWQLAAGVQFPLAVLHPDKNNIALTSNIVNGTDYKKIQTFSEFAEQQKNMEKEYQEEKEDLTVATYKFQSGETLEELLKSDNDFPSENALLDNLIDGNIRAVYRYATEEEQKVLRQFAAFRNDYDIDMKNLAVQTDCISRWIAAEHWNPEKQEFQKEYVNQGAIKDFPYKLPWEMKEIEAQVLKTKNEILDNGIESIQVNGGMSEAAMEAEIRSQEKEHHEVEEYNDGQFPLQVVAHTDFNYFNSDKISFKEYIVRTDASVVQDLIEKNADSFNETNTKLEENAIPCIIVRKSVNPEIPDQFLLSKYENNNLNKDEIAKQAGKFASKEIKIENTELVTQIKNVIDWNDKQNKTQTDIPELKIYHTLKEDDVKNLEVISDQEFSDIVDSIILNDYKNIPNAIRLPNLNEQLSEKLGLEKDSAFILKKNATHIRPDRKGGYGQAFDAEEYRRIPEILRNAGFAVVDTVFQNFQIVFDDKNDGTKINKLVFNKDELGNYLVTLGKVDRESAFSEERNPIVAVGVAPTIQTLRTSASSTALRASTTMGNESIAQSKENASSLSKNYTKVAVGVEPTIWRAQKEHPIATMLRSSTTLATEETISQVTEKSINEEKIKMPDQPVYAAAKVGQVIEQRTQEAQSIVNPTRADRLSTISVPLNKEYNEDFTLSTEKNALEKQESINAERTKLQILEQEDKEQLAAIVMTARETIKDALEQNAESLVEIDFSKANYDKLFPRAIVQTPIETVKLGENQFEKLDAKDRKRFLLATFQTLATPDIVIDEEREGSHSHNYIKSFVFDEKTKTIQDVVVNINGENVSITAHPRDINNIVNKIKMPDQLVYAAAKVGQVIEQRVQNELGIVNPTRADRLSTISVPLNKEYNEDFALSTVKKLLETEKNMQNAAESELQQTEPGLQKKFDQLKEVLKSREEQDSQEIDSTEEPKNKMQPKKSKSDIIRQAGKDLLEGVKKGIAPFFNTEDDFQRIIMHPQAIINASNGLPFSGESQLLAQIYHKQHEMEGEIVTSIAGAKAAGTIVLNTKENLQKNFALTDTSLLAEKNTVVRTRYFMPESCKEPDKIYAHTLQQQRPDKIRSYRDLIRHFENIPNGQKEITDIRIRIAHEHLKEIQSRFAIKEERTLSVDEIEERKNFLRNYFERLPADYRDTERSAFEDTFGIQLNSEKNLEINLQRKFKDIDFDELKKNTKKSIELENRKLSNFIEKNTMDNKKLASLFSNEYKSLAEEEKLTARNLKIEALGIKEPETFLGKYLAACNTNAEFITDKETVEEVKKNLVKKLEENFKLEKYDILKEIGQQAQSISNETTKQISFEKAHSNNKSLGKTLSPDKEISLIGMGK